MQNKIYKAKKGATFGNKKAQIYGERLEQLEEKHSELTPDIVWNDAKKESSPLHGHFEWDKDKAHIGYLRYQARQLLNHIIIEIEDVPAKEVSAFYNVVSIIDEKPRYVSLEKTMNEAEYKQQILKKALKEITYWQQKYQTLLELSYIFKAIEKVKTDVEEIKA